MNDIYYIYILRCEDNSLYTGIAKDYMERYQKHIEGTGAKYTRARKPRGIEKVWAVDGRSAASRVEYFLKKHPKKIKEKFVAGEKSFSDRVKKELELDIEVIK